MDIQQVVEKIYEVVTAPCAIYDPEVREKHYKSGIEKVLEEARNATP